MHTDTTPTPETLAALKAYTLKHGRTWRAKLCSAWANGSDTSEPGGHLLRQLRNNYGPSWLATYKAQA